VFRTLLGAIGYATTIAEIGRQAAELGIRPAAIVHCSGSAGTQAGLVVGAAACMPQTRIVGVDIDAEPERVRSDVTRLAREAAERLDVPFSELHIDVVAGHAGPAYGCLMPPPSKANPACRQAGGFAGRTRSTPGRGLRIDCSHPGGTMERRRRRDFHHTHGRSPALFAYQSALTFSGSRHAARDSGRASS